MPEVLYYYCTHCGWDSKPCGIVWVPFCPRCMTELTPEYGG